MGEELIKKIPLQNCTSKELEETLKTFSEGLNQLNIAIGTLADEINESIREPPGLKQLDPGSVHICGLVLCPEYACLANAIVEHEERKQKEELEKQNREWYAQHEEDVNIENLYANMKSLKTKDKAVKLPRKLRKGW
jgi:hypothetical protein